MSAAVEDRSSSAPRDRSCSGRSPKGRRARSGRSSCAGSCDIWPRRSARSSCSWASRRTPTATHVRVVEGWYAGAFMDEPFEYDTDGLPCALAAERAVVAFPDALTERFPEDQIAVDMGLESYLAVCLRACRRDAPRTPGRARRPADGGRRRRPGDAADLRGARGGGARAAPAGGRARGLAHARHRGRRRRAAADRARPARRRAAAADGGRELPHGRAQDRPTSEVLELAADELDGGERRAARARARSLPGRARRARAQRARWSRWPPGVPCRSRSTCRTSNCPSAWRSRPTSSPASRWRTRRRYARAGTALTCARRSTATPCASRSRDDGVGGADPAAGTGLRGLVDRMEILGGSLEVTSPPGAGTRITGVDPARVASPRWPSRSVASPQSEMCRGASSAAARRWRSSRLQAGWTALSAAEREEVRRLVVKSKGRPKSLSREEARRLGRLAAKAARAAAATGRDPRRTRGTG